MFTLTTFSRARMSTMGRASLRINKVLFCRFWWSFLRVNKVLFCRFWSSLLRTLIRSLLRLLIWDNYKDFPMLELQSAQDGVNLQPIGTILRPIKALILGNTLGTKYAKNIGF